MLLTFANFYDLRKITIITPLVYYSITNTSLVQYYYSINIP